MSKTTRYTARDSPHRPLPDSNWSVKDGREDLRRDRGRRERERAILIHQNLRNCVFCRDLEESREITDEVYTSIFVGSWESLSLREFPPDATETLLISWRVVPVSILRVSTIMTIMIVWERNLAPQSHDDLEQRSLSESEATYGVPAKAISTSYRLPSASN